MPQQNQDNGKDHSSKAGKRLFQLLEVLWNNEKGFELMDGAITEIRLKKPKTPGDDVMIIVKARVDGQSFIAFSGGYNAGDGLRTALERIQNGQIKWRDDQPYLPGLEPPKK